MTESPSTDPSQGTTKKMAVKKSARSKKTAGGGGPPPVTSRPDGQVALDPQAVATLAVQLLQPKLAELHTAGRQLSSHYHDTFFLDALKRAESLLELAAGLSDTDVHAYQIFDERAAPMSFEDIAERFKEVGWKGLGSKTTIKPYVEQLVCEADKRITDWRNDFDRRLSRKLGEHTNFDAIRCRLVRYLTSMGRRTRLARVVGDVRGCAEGAADKFLEIICKNNPGLQGGFHDEYWETRNGYETFIEYVCGGLRYEQFMGEEHLSQHLSTDRLASISFYLEELCSGSLGLSPSRVADDLAKLSSLIGPDAQVPREVGERMGACIRTLRTAGPDLQAVREDAGKAAQVLKPFLDYLRYCEWWRVLDVNQTRTELERVSTDLNSTEVSAEGDQLVMSRNSRLELIEHLGVGASFAKDFANGQHSSHYAKFQKQLSQCALMVADSFRAAGPSVALSKLVVALDEISQSTDAELQVPTVSKKTKWIEVDELLKKLTPYSGDRKIRPYELFLFAAQEHLLEDKLVVKQSSLNPGRIPNPMRHLGSSILWSHGGCGEIFGGAQL